jgi:Arc/MetJ-type ribon-helix-helix transcriptional regulator
MKKIIVSLPDGVVEILDKEVIGKIGEGYSDTIRTIIMNWLGEQGYLKAKKQETAESKNNQSEDPEILLDHIRDSKHDRAEQI